MKTIIEAAIMERRRQLEGPESLRPYLRLEALAPPAAFRWGRARKERRDRRDTSEGRVYGASARVDNPGVHPGLLSARHAGNPHE